MKTNDNNDTVVIDIAIDDGFCTWQYPLRVSCEESVNSIYKKICKTFGCKPEKGTDISCIELPTVQAPPAKPKKSKRKASQ